MLIMNVSRYTRIHHVYRRFEMWINDSRWVSEQISGLVNKETRERLIVVLDAV